MSLLESYRHGRRITRLARTWHRLHPYLHMSEADRQHGSASDFLQIKKEIVCALSALEGGFGSTALDREAEQAATRIRHLLAQLSTRDHAEAWLARDSHGLARAWHGVFLSLAVLSGACAKRSPLLALAWGAPRVSAEPSRAGAFAQAPRAVGLGGILRGAVALVIVVAAFFVAERLFRLFRGDEAPNDVIAAPSGVLR